MTHYIHKCACCGARYTYQGSGHGCHDPLNDSHLCPECMKVLLAANRRRRYEKREQEFEPSECLLQEMAKVKADYQKKLERDSKDAVLPFVLQRYFFDKYDNVDTYHMRNGDIYVEKWNDDAPGEKKYFRVMEYDTVEKEFTGNLACDYGHDGGVCFNEWKHELPSKPRKVTQDDIEPNKLRPCGQVMYMDMILDADGTAHTIDEDWAAVDSSQWMEMFKESGRGCALSGDKSQWMSEHYCQQRAELNAVVPLGSSDDPGE